MKRPLVIYHANCPDGFGAAYAAFSRFRSGGDSGCDFAAASYGQPPPEVSGRDVYIVDFSCRRHYLGEMCTVARTVTILDHHATAERDLAGLTREHSNFRLVFDMNRSGAVLAWEHFHGSPPPKLLLHIQDRDLWRLELEGTNDIHAALVAQPFDFTALDGFVADEKALAALATDGKVINRYRRVMIDMHKGKAVMGRIEGHRVPVVNCDEEITSDLLAELAAGYPFAASYQDQVPLRKWSLRSSVSGIDVATIAERFGGGGHRHASGFVTQLSQAEIVLSSHL